MEDDAEGFFVVRAKGGGESAAGVEEALLEIGGEGGRDNWFTRIGTSLVPEGRIELRHSSIYNNESVEVEIVAWMRLEEGGGSC